MSERYLILKHFCWIVVLSIIVPTFTYATHSDQIFFQRIGQAEGLSQTNIFAILEDSEGFLWFGTQNAADRFDGFGFETFRHEPDNADSLTRGSIRDFLNDTEGQFWIATVYGVSVFDPISRKLKRVFEHEIAAGSSYPGDPKGIYQLCEDEVLYTAASKVWRIDTKVHTTVALELPQKRSARSLSAATRDQYGQLWISDSSDLWVYDCDQQQFHHKFTTARDNSYLSSRSLLTTMQTGKIAWASAEGIQIIDPITHRPLSLLKLQEDSRPHSIMAINSDHMNFLWVATFDALFRVSLSQNDLEIDDLTKVAELTQNWRAMERLPPLQIANSSDGLIWISLGRQVGIYRPGDGSFLSLEHDPLNNTSLPPISASSGYDLYSDRFGNVWLGSKLGGIAVYAPERHRFDHIKDYSMPSYVVRGISEEYYQNHRYTWIGLDAGWIQLWEHQANNHLIKHTVSAFYGDEEVDLSTQGIRSMATHPVTGSVWFTSTQWFGRLNVEEKSATLISPQGTPHSRRFRLAFTPDGRYLYQSTRTSLLQHGFDDYGDLVNTTELDWIPDAIDNEPISSFFVLRDNSLILLTAVEAYHISVETKKATQLHWAGSGERVIGGQIRSLYAPTMTDIWLGTLDSGLIRGTLRLDEGIAEILVIEQFDESNGLPDRTIYAITPDGEGNLWFSSNQGISRLNIATSEVANFSVSDGLQGTEFNTGVVHRTAHGEIYFGGVNGANLFRPAVIQRHPRTPDVSLVSFHVNGDPLSPSTSLELSHDEQNWVIQYTGLHFTSPKDNRFAYRLLGLDPQWVEAGSERIARYTGLPPGSYQFWVRSANADDVWSQPKLILEATINPPFWATNYAFAFYASALVFLMLTIATQSHRRRIRLQALVNEQTEELQITNRKITEQAKALEEALTARTTFFANVSHELKTPLTLIDANLNNVNPSEPEPARIKMAQKYVNRMSRLIDQILDVSRIQQIGSEAASAPWSLTVLINLIIDEYSSIAESKRISLNFESRFEWMTQINRTSVIKVVDNLLSNAIKYTPQGGFVQITVESDVSAGVWIRFKDSGKGFSESESKLIFERFYRVPAQEADRTNGSGLGLALVSDAVKAVGGSIDVQSQPGKGSLFSVWLPATRSETTDNVAPTRPKPQNPSTEIKKAYHEPADYSQSLGSLLVVEDNDDLKELLAKDLSNQWVVYTASDGEEALAQLSHHSIDVVLSDIMMPHMDGFELLSRVRNDLQFSHIPFVFLTARSDDETELKSLMLTADDFIRKPFNPNLLAQKLKNIRQAQLRLQIQMGLLENPTELADTQARNQQTISPTDQKFIARLLNWLPENYADVDLSVASMAHALAVEERTLQRKIKALYGQTPLDFIHDYRIREAVEKLNDGCLTIQEVAYQTGYRSGQYFSRIFAKHKGMSPSQWRKMQK